MNFEVKVLYDGNVYVKLNDVLANNYELGETKKSLKAKFHNQTITISGLSRTLWVMLKTVEELFKTNNPEKDKFANMSIQEMLEMIDENNKKYLKI